jgi:hypothetical protein
MLRNDDMWLCCVRHDYGTVMPLYYTSLTTRSAAGSTSASTVQYCARTIAVQLYNELPTETTLIPLHQLTRA